MSVVTAKVMVELDIAAEGVWSDKTTVAQVKKQAMEDVELKLKNLFNNRNDGIQAMYKPKCINIKYSE